MGHRRRQRCADSKLGVMIRWFKQLWCGYRGHPYPESVIAECGPFPQSPDEDTIYCTHCGAAIARQWTDNAGTERRGLTR